MIERAGYPGIAADVDLDKVASVLPVMKQRAFEMYAKGEALTGHKGLPPEPTWNLAADQGFVCQENGRRPEGPEAQ